MGAIHSEMGKTTQPSTNFHKRSDWPYFLPSKDVIWKQKRLSSQSTAITEQLSKSITSPPATSPRHWLIKFPPWVKKYCRSHVELTKLVLLKNKWYDDEKQGPSDHKCTVWQRFSDESTGSSMNYVVRAFRLPGKQLIFSIVTTEGSFRNFDFLMLWKANGANLPYTTIVHLTVKRKRSSRTFSLPQCGILQKFSEEPISHKLVTN